MADINPTLSIITLRVNHLNCCCPATQSCLTLCNQLQHARLPCPSPSLGAFSNSCLILCHTLILLSSCPQSFPASGSFPVSRLFASGGQSVEASTSASVLSMNIQSWFPLGLTGLISLQSKDSQESSPTSQFKSINSSALSLLYGTTLTSIHDYWKNQSCD